MIKCEGEFSGRNKKGANVRCVISGNGELVAVEYATITLRSMGDEGGRRILERATDIMKKEINDYEEKRRS